MILNMFYNVKFVQKVQMRQAAIDEVSPKEDEEEQLEEEAQMRQR